MTFINLVINAGSALRRLEPQLYEIAAAAAAVAPTVYNPQMRCPSRTHKKLSYR